MRSNVAPSFVEVARPRARCVRHGAGFGARIAVAALRVTLLLCCASGAIAHAGELENAVRAALEARRAPGAVVVVGDAARERLHAAFGARAVEPALEPMTADTLFDLASLTKPIATATSVMLLVERGRIELAAPVARYLPEFGAHGKESITVEHLLRHWSGLLADNPLADYAGGREAAWRKLCELAPRSTPGTAFVYSDVGYIVLGELVERVDGRSLARFAREELFEPLAMHETTFCPSAELAARCAPTERRAERWMRGEVHDPRAYALGGVAGHAGLFSTARDVARWCRMLLGGGALDGVRVMRRETAAAMLAMRTLPDGSGGRTLGLDADTPYSSARGELFPRGTSCGHTGFTGTSLWLDPASSAYVVLLTNRVHPDGTGDVKELRAAVATAAARLLRTDDGVLTGVDVLARSACEPLRGRKLALLTNTTGRTRAGERTVDLLRRSEGLELVCILSPEHGFGARAEGVIAPSVDAPTGLPIHSLYGESRRPTEAMLAGCDTLVFDVQDVGTRIYTYESTLGYAMEAAQRLGLRVVVLDRPNPLGALAPQGPLADSTRLDFTSYRPVPLVHGLTIGELARLYREHFGVRCELEVVACEGWKRSMRWDDTGLLWIAPSPNLRTPTQALLYPGVALLETTNVSVGRGTDTPFEHFGAPWIDARQLARALNVAALPGLRFVATEFTPSASRFAGELCRGVQLVVVERERVKPVLAGLAFARVLRELHGTAFEFEKVDALLRNRATFEALRDGASLELIERLWDEELAAFERACAAVRLY